LSPKIYIWKKKETPTLTYKTESRPIAQAPEEKEKFSLKKDEESQLKKLRTKIETKS
jgi:hypothetical protein